MKTQRLADSCEHKRRYFFVPLANQASRAGLKTINSNAFRLNFFALFEIFCVYMSANLICKQTVTVWCEHMHINSASIISLQCSVNVV
jgi:hypothetical protein